MSERAAPSRFDGIKAVAAGAVAQAPARVVTSFGDHVACGLTYVGLVVDVLPCGTFVCDMRDPLTGRVHTAPFHATSRLRVVEARR